jgi:S1-C subfamily serine protease
MSRKAIVILFIAMFAVSLLTSAVAGAAAGIMAVRSAPAELLRGQANNAPSTAPGPQAPNNRAQPNTPNNPFPNGGFGRGFGGAVVSEVVSGSPAEKAGLQAGDVILAVNGTRLDTNHTLTALLQTAKPGDSVALSVRRQGQGATTLNVTLGASPTDANTPYLGIRYQSAPLNGGSPTG